LEAESSQISTVADEFSEFLTRLKEDLRAFIADDREHHYVV
jgi:hypothetical protein